MKRAGFTLIELLIVVFIISILAAILFPVFGKARDKARQANCQSNVMQLGLALHLYAQDWNGRFPPRNDDWSPAYRYAKDYQLFMCPIDPAPRMPDYARRGNSLGPGMTSYIYRAGLANDDLAGEILAWDRETWHSDGRNFLFLDAHVKWMRNPVFWEMAPNLRQLDSVWREHPEERESSDQGSRL
jgi:prepilin-type N-terminal cleavage/methylation domain-containing protein/prepilin-type processing-associated H-X9-DG protein